MSPKENLSRRLEKLERDALDVGEPPQEVWVESTRRDLARRFDWDPEKPDQSPVPNDSPELVEHDRRVLEQQKRAERARGVFPPSPEEAEGLRRRILEMFARKDEEGGFPAPPSPRIRRDSVQPRHLPLGLKGFSDLVMLVKSR